MPRSGPADFPNIRHCQLFCEAIRCGSVSRAADKLNLTQPAASQGIARLERELGAALLIRGGSGVTPTEPGRVFADRVTRALDHLRQGAQQLVKSGSGRTSAAGLVRNMTSAQLRALIAVAEAGSFRVAAAEIGVAQPTVHRAAREFEALTGVDLLRARVGGVEVTPQGASMVQQAKLARDEIRLAREEIAALTGNERFTFILGSLPLARSEILPNAVDEMIRGNSSIQIRVLDGRYTELLRGLREGDIDCIVGALRGPDAGDGVIEEPVMTDRLAIVCRAGHPLTARTEVSLADTLAYPWIAPPRDTPSGQVLFDALDIQSLPQTPVRVVSSSLVLMRGLLAAGNYVTIISRHQVRRELESGVMVALPVPLGARERPIGLTTRRNWFPSRAQRDFVDLLRRHVQQASLAE